MKFDAPHTWSRPAARRRGFTLVELLVVIGIGLLLMAIVLPAINAAYNQSVRAKIALDLQAIATALEAYRQDHGDIPRPSPDGTPVSYTPRPGGTDGAIILCRALIGPGDEATDGAAGPGFRTVPLSITQSKVTGPYLTPDRFKLVQPDGTDIAAGNTVQLNSACLADRNGRVILYYPAIKSANVSAPNGYVANVTWGTAGQPKPMFNALDNSMYMPIEKLRLLLGDDETNEGGVLTTNAKNGRIDPPIQKGVPERAAFTGAFLLISPGLDEEYGPAATNAPIGSKNPCDDVCNFERSSSR